MSFHVRQVTLSKEIPLISSGDVSYHCNDQVINDLARDSHHNSDFLTYLPSWHVLSHSVRISHIKVVPKSKQIYDFSLTHFKERVNEPFPSPVHVIHPLS